jgi:hypothetical protein
MSNIVGSRPPKRGAAGQTLTKDTLEVMKALGTTLVSKLYMV